MRFWARRSLIAFCSKTPGYFFFELFVFRIAFYVVGCDRLFLVVVVVVVVVVVAAVVLLSLLR